ncbi:MAG TPA: nuclear transport factor 2 family protein [Candidatus Limnocylindria bacterium]|nr:nuclear transport factor 2 family protein [Candidatus Limnocylindria bacterium]
MHTNAKILHDAIETVNTGDPEAAVGLLADDVEWHEIGRSEPTRGKEAVIQRFTESFGDAEVEATEHAVIADDEHAVQLMNVTARRGDKTLNYRTAEIFHMRDGKITARWAFSDDTRAIIDFFA